jgi:hypothetical protein
MLLAAVIYLITTRHLRREEPSTVYGVTPGHAHAAGAARKGSSAVADTRAADSDDDESGPRDSLPADSGDEDSDGDEPGAADSGDDREKSNAGDDAPESDVLRG